MADPIAAGIAEVLADTDTNDLLVEYETSEVDFSVEFAWFDDGDPVYNVASLPADEDHVSELSEVVDASVVDTGDVYVTFCPEEATPEQHAERVRALATELGGGDGDIVRVERRSL